MRVQGEDVSIRQIAAGEAAMVGSFRSADVRDALSAAGVTNTDRVADALVQKARRSGIIEKSANQRWTRVS